MTGVAHSANPTNITSRDIASSFWMAPILDYLTDVDSFLKFCESSLKVEYDRNILALGYSFASCLALQRLIQAVLDSPAVFGADYDEKVERAFQGDVSFLKMPTESAQGRLAVKIAQTYRPLLGVRSFDGREMAIRPIRNELLPALYELLKSYDISTEYSHLFHDLRAALLHTATVGLHLFYQNVKMVRIAFSVTFGRSKDSWAQMTELPEVINKKQRFFEGYKLAVGYLWYSFLGDEVRKYPSIASMLESATWKEFGSLYRAIQSEVIDPIEKPIDVFGRSRVFVAKSSVRMNLVERISRGQGSDFKVQEPSDEERLDRIFLSYPVRIVDHDLTASNASGFVIALTGASIVTREKIKVRKFVHGHHFSYALLIPASSNVGGYSIWWLFYDFCSDDSGMGSAGYFEVEKCLQRLAERLGVEVHPFDNLVLRDYAENHSEIAQLEAYEPDFDSKNLRSILGRKFSPSFRKQLASAKQGINKLKGMILELVVSTIMSQSGYLVAWGYQNSAILGDGEIDVLGLRTDSGRRELVVVECTTAFDKSLFPEVTEKMEKVANSVPDIAKELHWIVGPGECVVKGLIVTTDSEKKPENPSPDNIAVWHRKEFLGKCEANGIKTHGIERLFPERKVPDEIEISSMGNSSKLWDLKHKEDDD